MCRCEAILYVQKMQDLGDGGADVQMAHGLAKACSPRIGTARIMDSHPADIILASYSEVKDKVVAKNKWRVTSGENKKHNGASPAKPLADRASRKVSAF